MTTTPTKPEPAKAKSVQPPPAPRAESETRPPSRVGRFFTRLLMLAILCAGSFGGGYYVMDQEARLHHDVLVQEQVTAQGRIAALEEQIRDMQLNRMQENTIEVDLTDVFTPIREAVSRLTEAHMTIVAQQISAEIAQRVDADAQNLNASAPLAAIAGAAATALEPAIAAAPPAGAQAEAPPPEPVAELTPREPPGSPDIEPAAGAPGGDPAPDSSRAAPGADAAQSPAASVQRPASALAERATGGRLPTAGAAGEGFPSRVPQWLTRLADSLDNARSRLDTATSTPAPGVAPSATPVQPRIGG